MRVLIFGFLVFCVFGCNSASDELWLKVDMASLHDEGLFKPDEGDKISLAGSFNDWEAGEYYLQDIEDNWVYSYNLNELITEETGELEFKFVITSAKNRELVNGGWERIPNRSITPEDIRREQPVLNFNKPWSPLVTKKLSFRLNMSNQKVLGFFDPDMGDKVAVTGSFNNWNEEGVLLEPAEDSLVYQFTFPAEVRKHEPLVYTYLIIPGTGRNEKVVMPNKGREFINNRYYREELATEYFNNQKRVLRVELTEEWIAQKTLKQDDVLHLKLMWNGSQSRNYRMEPMGEGAYETALQIPETAADLKAKVMVNYEEEVYELNIIKVGLEGGSLLLGM
ncbi:MAG: hypothetical protein WD016_08800 [Balneolaceae bacterium]